MGELKAGAAAPCTASFSGGKAADHSSDALPALLTAKPSSTPGTQCQAISPKLCMLPGQHPGVDGQQVQHSGCIAPSEQVSTHLQGEPHRVCRPQATAQLAVTMWCNAMHISYYGRRQQGMLKAFPLHAAGSELRAGPHFPEGSAHELGMLAPAVALQRQKCRGEAAASSSARVWSVAGSRCTGGASPSPTSAYTCCSAVPSCTGGPASSICEQN